MKVLIVDDEPLARSRLANLVEELDVGDSVSEAANGQEALRLADSETPDIVLLDIRMPGMDGLEVARHLSELEQPPAVIFTTAYDSHALDAFETNAVGYLLKPIRKARLAAAVERAGKLTRAQILGMGDGHGGEAAARTHISATMNGRLHLVPVTEILYLQAAHKYVTVRFTDGEVLIEESLGSLEEEFGERFLRVHRNALVSVDAITGMEKDEEGRPCIRLRGSDETVEVSRRSAGEVRRFLKRRGHA